MSTPNPTSTDWIPLWDLNGGASDFHYRGAYVGGTPYSNGDVVIGSDGIAYLCVADGVTAAPIAWTGIYGPTGPPGPQGPQGPKGDIGATGPGLPTVQNGKWLNGLGGVAVWASLAIGDIPQLPATKTDGLVTADTAWVAITTYVNSWRDYGSGFPGGRFRKLASGLIVLSGLLSGGTSGTIAFTLPVGYRPDLYRHCHGLSNDGIGTVRINANGECQLNFPSGGWFSLDGVCFYP